MHDLSESKALKNEKQKGDIMKTIKLIILTISLMSSITWAYGTNQHEISATVSQGEISFGNSVTQIAAGSSYSYLISRGIQVGGDAEFLSINGNGQNNTYMALFGTGTWNFPMSWDIRNAIFVRGGIGFADVALASSNASGSAKSELGFKVMAGKRFILWDRVLYAPMAGIIKVGSNDAVFKIIPINVSLQF